MTPENTPHLLLVNLGTPTAATPEAVREFLAEFLSDPAVVDFPRWIWQPILRGFVLRSRPGRVAEQYESIWSPDGSPLKVATEAIAGDVRARAEGRFTVSTAYRYGEPSIDSEIHRLAREHHGPVIVVPLFPHRTDATTGTAFRRARQAATVAKIGHRVLERLIPPAVSGYVEAMAARWHAARESATAPIEHIVISFHGIPVRYDRREGSVYVSDCKATTDAFLAAIDWPADRATLSFQSRFGPEKWLTPSTARVLEQLPARGIRSVAVITPGFVTEGLETLEEIGIRGRESFIEAGGTHFLRIGAVDQHPGFVDALCALALE